MLEVRILIMVMRYALHPGQTASVLGNRIASTTPPSLSQVSDQLRPPGREVEARVDFFAGNNKAGKYVCEYAHQAVNCLRPLTRAISTQTRARKSPRSDWNI